MNELVKYFEALEQRIAALEAANKELTERLEALAAAPAPQEPQEPAEEEEAEVEIELIVDDEPEEEPEAEAAPEPEIEPEPVAEPEPVVEPEPQPEQPEQPKQEEPQPEEEPKPQQPQQGTLFGQPVSNIRQAISLGDRFLFQRELFAQNGEKMQKALDDIDKLMSFDDAVAYIEKHFQWDKESSTYELFINILHRRF